MHRNQVHQVIVGESLITADVAGDSQVVEGHEDAVSADEGQPEVDLAQSLVHHAAGHLGEPEEGSAEDAEDGGNRHHQVEVAHHEVGRVQHDVDGGLSQEEAADAAADEHRDETQREQRSRIDPQLGAVHAAQPDQDDDGGRNRDDERGEGKRQRRERIHSADEHVVPVHHVTQNSNRAHAGDDHAVTEQRPTHVGDENVGDDSHARHDRDVHLRVPEEPEQVLPQQSGSAGMGQYLAVDHQV